MAKRVLVVEDNELNLKLFCDLLRAHGHDVLPLRDGRDVLAQAREFEPDLVITDIHLPHVSGYDLIVSLKGDDSLSAVPIMAVTAYSAQGDDERIRAAGASAYVSKPISVLRFAETVEELLIEGAAKKADAENEAGGPVAEAAPIDPSKGPEDESGEPLT